MFVVHTQPKTKFIVKKPIPPQITKIVAIPKPILKPLPIPKKMKFRLSFIRDTKKPKKDLKNLGNSLTPSKTKKQRKINQKIEYSNGRWKEDEHKRFIEAIIKFGNDWKQVQKYVRTRSSTQARSHAQKFFVKVKKAKILDFTLDLSKTSIKMFHELIKNSTQTEYEKILNSLIAVGFDKQHSTKKRKKENDNTGVDEEEDPEINEMDQAFKPEEPMPLHSSTKEIDLADPQNQKEIHYIFNTFINHISNDELYGVDTFNQISATASHSNNTEQNFIGKRKRSSINSISGFFKGYIDDNEIKNLNLGNESTNLGFSNEDAKNFLSNSRKISQDDDYMINYYLNNKNNINSNI